ncbi:hypothetical protein LEMLEM_LOCUS4092 [Lemmus lemmus]
MAIGGEEFNQMAKKSDQEQVRPVTLEEKEDSGGMKKCPSPDKCGYHPSPKELLFATNGHNAETEGLWRGEGEALRCSLLPKKLDPTQDPES